MLLAKAAFELSPAIVVVRRGVEGADFGGGGD